MKGILIRSLLSAARRHRVFGILLIVMASLLVSISSAQGDSSADVLYWKGGIDNNWATSNGGTNWTTDAGGLNTSLTIPVAASNVFFREPERATDPLFLGRIQK